MPLILTVVASIHVTVVLLIERVRFGVMGEQFMDALAEFRECL